MTARFIVRLLTADFTLLAWAEVLARPEPQGRPRSTPFRPITPTQFVIEQDGIATQLTVHWADLDVARVTPLMEPVPVQVGQVVTFTWIEPVWMVQGSPTDFPMPAVTVRKPVAVSIPAGGLGVASPG